MYTPPSDRFIPALSMSHKPVTRVQMFTSDGRVIDIDHTGGSVTIDATQSVRRTCTVTATDLSLIPIRPSDQLAVYGAKIRIERGIDYQDGSDPELVPLGFFRVDRVEGDPDLGPVTISGSSMEAVLADDPFITPYSTRGVTMAIAAITGIIEDSIPDAVVVGKATDGPIGTTTWDAQADRWQAITDCATAIGAQVYCDADGQFVIANQPDVATSQVAWTVDAGETGVLITATRAYDRDGMYNVVVASGENTEDNVPPVSATAEDDDPTSPTYVGGPFGRVTQFYSSATLTTLAACQQAANQLLAQAVKPSATVSVESAPNPLLDAWDVLRVTYGNGDRELHQIQSFDLDLGNSSTTFQTIGGKQDS